MKLKIKLIDKTLPVPEYQTKGSVAFDLYSRVSIVAKPWTPTLIPANIIVQVPKGFMLMLASRSSTARKFGFILSNCVGIIDQDYSGERDEIGVEVLNFNKKPLRINRGDRLGQAVLVKIAIPEKIILVDKMKSKSRGGWGSTGHKQIK